MRAGALSTLAPALLLASALTAPLEVLALASGFLALHSALIGFVALLRKQPPREIADAMAVAIAAGFPIAVLVAGPGTIILIATR